MRHDLRSNWSETSSISRQKLAVKILSRNRTSKITQKPESRSPNRANPQTMPTLAQPKSVSIGHVPSWWESPPHTSPVSPPQSAAARRLPPPPPSSRSTASSRNGLGVGVARAKKQICGGSELGEQRLCVCVCCLLFEPRTAHGQTWLRGDTMRPCSRESPDGANCWSFAMHHIAQARKQKFRMQTQGWGW